MKKILSGLMLLILVVLFAATYVCSSKTEEVFKAQIEQLNQDYAGIVNVELLDYQRGFLVSEVKTKINLQQESLPLQHQIRHFPWKVRMLTGVAEGSDIAAGLAEQISLEQLQLQTDVSLSGSSQSHFSLPELTLADDEATFTLKGLRFDFDLEEQLSGGNLFFRLEGLSVVEAGSAELTIADVEMDSSFTDLQGLPLGGGDFLIGKVSLQQAEKPIFELNELRYNALSRLENEQLTSGLDLQLAGLALGGETFTDARLQLQVSGIDAAAVRELRTNARQMQADLLGQQIDPVILQLQLLGLYSRLFQAGLTVSLTDVSLQADEGTMQGKGSVTLQELNLSGGASTGFDKIDGQFQLDVDSSIFNAGFRALDNLQRQGRSANPAVLNEQAEQLAGGLIQKGIFTRRENGGYRLDLSIKQGQAELNGNAFRL